jgi:hypothetical protein
MGIMRKTKWNCEAFQQIKCLSNGGFFFEMPLKTLQEKLCWVKSSSIIGNKSMHVFCVKQHSNLGLENVLKEVPKITNWFLDVVKWTKLMYQTHRPLHGDKFYKDIDG